jgi:HAD superfamily hydrolase (TIGR01549 family)
VADDARGGVVFDVDGTLLDTNYLHVAAWWEAFRERGHDIRCADIHRALGMGSEELIKRVLGKPDPSVSAAHSRHYAPYLGRIRPLPGAADLLRATARLGLDVVLATSAKSDEVDLMLDALGAGSAISAAVSSGDVERAKPDPGIVQKALDVSGVDPGRAVMVGDTVWDVFAAERAGIGVHRPALWRDRRRATAQGGRCRGVCRPGRAAWRHLRQLDRAVRRCLVACCLGSR